MHSVTSEPVACRHDDAITSTSAQVPPCLLYSKLNFRFLSFFIVRAAAATKKRKKNWRLPPPIILPISIFVVRTFGNYWELFIQESLLNISSHSLSQEGQKV